jgi:hypothetical protein
MDGNFHPICHYFSAILLWPLFKKWILPFVGDLEMKCKLIEAGLFLDFEREVEAGRIC